MSELIFIGLGLNDEKDITYKGLEKARICDRIFAEFYTACLTGSNIERLSEFIGKEIEVLERKVVEDGQVILDAAKAGRVALLCVGDPMAATTHVDLRLRAFDLGIYTRVINNASILSAAPGLLGLQHYKFGRTITIPFPKEGFRPESPYEILAANKDRGLHTLALLDIDAESDRLMTANQALEVLVNLEERLKKGIVLDSTLVAVVAQAGSENPVVRAGYLCDMMKEDFGPPHHTIVFPGNLHFMEVDALVKLAGAPAGISN
jgi:diphthine synthase